MTAKRRTRKRTEVDDRLSRPEFNGEEEAERQDGDDAQGDDHGGRPPLPLSLVDGQDQAAQAQEECSRTHQVHSVPGAVAGLLPEHQQRHDARPNAQGDAQVEDGLPSQGVQEDASHGRPAHEADPHDGLQQAQGPAALLLRKGGGQDGVAQGDGHGGTKGLDHSEADELEDSLGQRAEDEPQSEDKQARYEDLLPAYDVSGAAYGEQRAGDGELVGQSYPHDDGGGGIEDAGERGEGDGDNAGVPWCP